MPAVFQILALEASYINYCVYMPWSSGAQQLKEIQAEDEFLSSFRLLFSICTVLYGIHIR